MKSECNESCIFIIFLQFLTDFTNSLFLEDKGTQTCRQVPRGLKQFAERPLAGVGTEEAAPGRRSCSLAARVLWGEQHEEAKSYLGMCSVDRGVAEIGVAGVQ